MKNEAGERFWLFLTPCWVLCVFFLLVFLKNSDWSPKTPETIYDLTYLIASLVFLMLPFVSRLKLGKLLDFERELGKTREDMNHFKNETRQMFSLFSAASATASNIVNLYGHQEGTVEAKGSEPTKEARTAMEYKILNTLWNKQVGKFPDINVFFTFRLNMGTPEFLAFREDGNRLMNKGLIGETDFGQFHLTQAGLVYCAKNFEAFPADMWGESEPLYKDNLDKVLKKLKE